MAYATLLNVAAVGPADRKARRSHAVSHQRCRTCRLARSVSPRHAPGCSIPRRCSESAVVPGAVGGTNWGNTAANPRRRHVVPAEPGLPVVLQAAGADRQCAAPRMRFGPPDAATLERGKKAYEEACAMCHGADRAGTPAAPSLLTVGGQIGGPQFRRIIVYGNGRMPPLPHVTEEQIGDILAFLGGGSRPRAPAGRCAAPTNAARSGGGQRRRAAPAGSRQRQRAATRSAGLPRRRLVRPRDALLHRLRARLSLSTGATVVDRSWPTTSIAASSSGASRWARISTLPRPAARTPACRAARSARA